MSNASRSNGSAPPTTATLRETIGRLAPGTALRDGLERILRGRTGALIVLGYDERVETICDGGFSLDVRRIDPPSKWILDTSSISSSIT